METNELYNILTTDDSNERLKYVALIATISIAILSYLAPYIGLGHIFALTLITTILPVMYNAWQSSTTSFIRDIELKLTTIDPEETYTYLYMDVNLVNLLFNVYGFKAVAPGQYEDLLMQCNDLLHLRGDFDTGALQDPGTQYNIACGMANKLLTLYHSFIYVISDKAQYMLFNTSFHRIRIIVRRQLDVMATYARKEPINIHKTYIRAPETPKPYDPATEFENIIML